MTANGDPGGHRILLVEPEASIAAAVTDALRPEGFDVVEAGTGREALAQARLAEPDVVIADWLLPDTEGIELARGLRARGLEPAVLFLVPDDPTDRMRQVLGGQDYDYLVTPFSRLELVRRTEAIFRRAGRGLPGEVLRFGDIVVDDARHEVRRGDLTIPLTGREFALLRYFVLNARLVLSKRQILENVWRHEVGVGSNVVETYVSYLRKKLNAAGPPVIKTVRQAGYVLDHGDGCARISGRSRS
jgi:two-component system OmpR family response regulator